MTILDRVNGMERLVRLKEKLLASLDTTGNGHQRVFQLREMVSDQFKGLEKDYRRLAEERDGLQTLAEIGETLTTTLDSRAILEKVLDSIIRLVEAERCFLMLLDEDGCTRVQIGRNWKHETLSLQEKTISSTIVNQVMEKREAVMTTNAETDPRFDGTESVMNYKLRSVMCAPLIFQDQLLGVLYADHRLRSEQFSHAKIALLSKFANQAAIALHNAKLFETLQQTHQRLQSAHSELEEAYDTTLEGWAKALELRDQTTEGHTKRVLALCLPLARAMGMGEKELVDFRRGAVLHDIGKMGIPDEVLSKPGKLTEEETEVMHCHPMLAVEMLSGIKFLRNALAIPLYHHERWDGSGYPHGLSGEDIPLAARIFAVVDVWDALTNERPYRRALGRTAARAHIKEGAGKHFDPVVVDKFFEMVGNEAGGERRYSLSEIARLDEAEVVPK